MLYILISILAGVSIVISRIINSTLANKIGIFQGTFFNYVVGLSFSFLFFFISSEKQNVFTIKLHTIPPWAYLGGLTGVLVVALSNYITPKISAFYLTLIIFVGQLFVGIIIDYLTSNILSPGKLIGGFLVLIGLSFNLIVDSRRTALNTSKVNID
jgi:bacterial/archaeal transporter family-2 protein